MTYQNSDLNYSEKLIKQKLLICIWYLRYLFVDAENFQMHPESRKETLSLLEHKLLDQQQNQLLILKNADYYCLSHVASSLTLCDTLHPCQSHYVVLGQCIMGK